MASKTYAVLIHVAVRSARTTSVAPGRRLLGVLIAAGLLAAGLAVEGLAEAGIDAGGADTRRNLDDVSYLVAPRPDGSFVTVAQDAPGGRQALDIRYPDSLDGDEAAPALIYVPGGGWGGQDETRPPRGGFRHYLGLGYAVVTVDYRVSSGPVGNAQLVYDVDRAVRWVRAHAGRLGIDPERIVLFGHSAGAHLAASVAAGDLPAATDAGSPVLPLRLASVSARPEAVVLLAGAYEFVDIPVGDPLVDWAARELSNCEAAPGDCAAGLRAASPSRRVSGDFPPAVLVHSPGDAVVDLAQSRYLLGLLCQADVPASLYTPAGTHELVGVDLGVVDEVLRRVRDRDRSPVPAGGEHCSQETPAA